MGPVDSSKDTSCGELDLPHRQSRSTIPGASLPQSIRAHWSHPEAQQWSFSSADARRQDGDFDCNTSAPTFSNSLAMADVDELSIHMDQAPTVYLGRDHLWPIDLQSLDATAFGYPRQVIHPTDPVQPVESLFTRTDISLATTNSPISKVCHDAYGRSIASTSREDSSLSPSALMQGAQAQDPQPYSSQWFAFPSNGFSDGQILARNTSDMYGEMSFNGNMNGATMDNGGSNLVAWTTHSSNPSGQVPMSISPWDPTAIHSPRMGLEKQGPMASSDLESTPQAQPSEPTSLRSAPGNKPSRKRKENKEGRSQKRLNASKCKILYICTIDGCEQQFSSRKDLHRHQYASLVHEEECETRYYCDEARCPSYGNSYTRKDNFDRHIEMMHEKLGSQIKE